MKKSILILSLVAILISTRMEAQISGGNESGNYDVETFLSILDEFLPERLVDNLGSQLPPNVTIVNFGLGDFSKDSLPDIVIAYKSKSFPKNTYRVMVFVNESLNSYLKVGELNAQWYDTPDDVAFAIKNQKLYISSRRKEKWCFETYVYTNKKLSLQTTEIY